jgi:hypothetical protein
MSSARRALRLHLVGLVLDLKPNHGAATEAEAQVALEHFDATWGKQYPSISRSWRATWEAVIPFFAFGPDIRRAIYTTNSIEALKRQLRKTIKPKGHFPSDEAALKVICLACARPPKGGPCPSRTGPSPCSFRHLFPRSSLPAKPEVTRNEADPQKSGHTRGADHRQLHTFSRVIARSGQAVTQRPQARHASALGVYAVRLPCARSLRRESQGRARYSSSPIGPTSNTP